MQTDKGKRSYARDLKLAAADSVVDAVMYMVAALAFAVALLMLLLDGKMKEALGVYHAAAVSGAATLAVLSLNGFATAIVRRRAVRAVTSESVYAVKLTKEQQDRIFRSLSRQIALSCSMAFLAVAVPVSAALLVRELIRKDGTSLRILLAVDAVWLLICLFSFFFEIADIKSRDGFCTVSDKGILTAGKVYDFDSSLGDVTALLCFEDCYSVRFRRRSFFWARLDTEYPLPSGGAISRELRDHDEREVLLDCLAPAQVLEMEGPYRWVSGSELVSATDRTAERAESLADGLDTAEEDRKAGFSLGGYVLRVAAALLIAAVGLFSAYVYTHGWPWTREKEPDEPVQPDPPVVDPVDEPDPEPSKYKLWKSDEGVWYFTYNDQDILFVDDAHPLPESFGGKDREASSALDLMYEAAEDDGIVLYTVKGYRSYEKQKQLYVSYDVPDWAVKEGLSEHQSGLAFDIDLMGVSGTMQDPSFEKTDAFSWLMDHAAEYGFILRYPKDKASVTGRVYEPWHFRYVGKELAQYLTSEGKVLDEIVEN